MPALSDPQPSAVPQHPLLDSLDPPTRGWGLGQAPPLQAGPVIQSQAKHHHLGSWPRDLAGFEAWHCPLCNETGRLGLGRVKVSQ